MADIVSLAEAVARELKPYGDAEVMFAPDLSLPGLKELRIIVAPIGLGMKPLARGYTEDVLTVQVGLLKRCTEDEIPSLIGKVTEIGRSFLDKRLEGATCMNVKYDPLFYPPHFKERRQFTGVIELSFKAVETR